MVPLDLLVLVGGGAVLPYLAEAAWDWLTDLPPLAIPIIRQEVRWLG